LREEINVNNNNRLSTNQRQSYLLVQYKYNEKVTGSLVFLYDKSMAENRQFFVLCITILLIVLSSCNAYQLFRDSSGMDDYLVDLKLSFEYLIAAIRPIKYHILNDPDQYNDRVRYSNNFFLCLKKFYLLNR
jgi:hypothetical protein